MELWTVLGLLCIDHQFRDDVFTNARDQASAQATVAKYGFHLSRYEVGEVVRWVTRHPKLRDVLHDQVHSMVWDDDTSCATGMTFDPAYKHHH